VEDLSEALAKERQNSVNAHSAVVVAAANAAQAAASNARDPTPTPVQSSSQAHSPQAHSSQGHSSKQQQQQQELHLQPSSPSSPALIASRSTSKVTFEIDASDDGDLSEEEMNFNGNGGYADDVLLLFSAFCAGGLFFFFFKYISLCLNSRD
jgi:hypothetical protein